MFAFMTSARKVLKAAVFAGGAMALAACQPLNLASGALGGGGGSGPSIDTSAPVPVALLVPKSNEGAGVVATSLENAARMAIADLTNVQIDLRVYDTFDNTANRLMSFAARQGKTKVLIAHPENVEGQFGRNAIQQAAARNGVQVASVNGFEFSQGGVVAVVPQIASAIESTGADSLILTSNSAGALPMLAQMLPEAGVSPATTQMIGLSRWDVPQQTLELPGLANGWFAIPDQQMMQNFEARYAQSYGKAPHQLAGLAYDGIAAIGALVEAGNRQALTSGALTQSAGFQGVGGAFRLRPNGTNERALSIAMVRDKQVVIIDPAPTKFSGAGF